MKIRAGLVLALLSLSLTGALAQTYGSRIGVQRGGVVSFEPSGPGVVFADIDTDAQTQLRARMPVISHRQVAGF